MNNEFIQNPVKSFGILHIRTSFVVGNIVMGQVIYQISNLLDLPISLRSSAMLLKDSYVYLVWSFTKMLVHGNLTKGTSSAQAFYSWYFCIPEQNPILKYGYSRLGSWYQSDLSKGTYTFVGPHNWLLSPPRPYLTRFASTLHLPKKCVYRLCLRYMRGSWSPNLFHFGKQNISGKFN